MDAMEILSNSEVIEEKIGGVLESAVAYFDSS